MALSSVVLAFPPMIGANAQTGSADLIAFNRITADGPVIYVMAADGSQSADIASGLNPAWAPDGRRIVYARVGAVTDLAVVDIDGSNDRLLTDDPAADVQPSWSPDGSSIAFVSTRDDNADIFTIDVATRSVTRLTRDPGADLHPAWSPDGTQIAFSSTRQGSMSIYTMRPDGSGVKRVSGSAVDWGPSWSPDGSRIAFASARDGPNEIYVMNADGFGARRMTNLDGADDASWSSDGDRIAFSRRFELYVLDVATGSAERVPSGGQDTDPAWRPDQSGAAGAHPIGAGPADVPAASVVTDTKDVSSTHPRAAIEARVGSAGASGSSARPPAAAMSAPNEAGTHARNRSSLAASLPRPGDLRSDVVALLASMVGAAFLLLLVFPGNLFSNTFEEHYDEIMGWFGRKPRLHRPPPSRVRRWATVGLTAGAMAVLGGLLDPSFGFDRSSLVLVLSTLGLFGLLTLVRLGQVAYLNRREGHDARISMFPGAIGIAALCVGISRAAAFMPGYLYGNLTGTATAGEISTREKGRAQALHLGVGLACSFTAWGLWCLVDDAAGRSDAALPVLVADAFLAACFVGGITSTLFAVIPMRWLDGHDVMRYSRSLWLALAVPTALVAVHLLLQPSEGTSGSVVLPMVLFVAFGTVSVLFWGYFRFRGSSRTSGSERTEPSQRVPALQR